MRLLSRLFVPACFLLLPYLALANTQVTVMETTPTGNNITLSTNQNFYLRLRYTSDTPTHIWVRPFFQGKPVNAGSNTSREHPAGSGEAVGWFFLFKPDIHVDEIRISAGDGSTNGTPVVASYPITLVSSDAVAHVPDPDWATTFLAAEKAAQKADYQQRMNTPVSTSGLVLFNGFMLTMYALGLLGLVWPLWGVWRWRGGYWRLAAALPGAGGAFVVLRILIDTTRDPTSHNLWPFEIVMWCGLSVLWMFALSLVKRLLQRSQ